MTREASPHGKIERGANVARGEEYVAEASPHLRSTRHPVPILTYHSIARSAQPRFAKFVTSPEVFAEHIAYLHDQGYTPITVSQFVHARSGGWANLPPRPVLLTVDDGYADFYSNALPILARHGFVATLYVVTGYIGGTSSWLQREGEANRPMLTWDELHEISEYGIECGAHTHTHPSLDTLTMEAARNEIFRSKSLLEDHLGRQVLSFAYPYGHYTKPVRAMVQHAGYSSACAVRYTSSSLTDDAYALARYIIAANTEVSALARLLDGRQPPGLAQAMHVRTSVWQYTRSGAVHVQRIIRKAEQRFATSS